MSDWEGCTTGTIRLPNPNQRSVSRKHIGSSILIHKGTLHGFSPERILALADERDNLDGVSLRQRIALFSVLIELWRSTARRIACVSVQFVQLGIDDFSGLCRCVRTTVSETVEARFCADRVEALLLSFQGDAAIELLPDDCPLSFDNRGDFSSTRKFRSLRRTRTHQLSLHSFAGWLELAECG